MHSGLATIETEKLKTGQNYGIVSAGATMIKASLTGPENTAYP
ncbi:hypothetical protein Z949_2103 [Sulfitobacter guttiformis KCTC 32187]|uniref:Uncharacterized protein n=1 Tax=Sulfitobacter guttiformis TaxID=74349 RepID=A0A420DN33_9RHOB|nr:hypothetical protein Z949_2103 [Sulfitobacter guttiformis KCTC 32187]RKE95610.1 hypothetical protein C8N30_0147 [Sulfitobacter guttiformis]